MANTQHLATVCVHGVGVADAPAATVGPIYPGTAYRYLDGDERVYPRYANTPNQARVAAQVAALEGARAGVAFGSGMAAISTALLAFLAPGEHVLMQRGLYGGTVAFAEEDLRALGVEVSYTDGLAVGDFAAGFRQNTRVVYLETPSNPLLNLVDVAAVAALARARGAVSMIDNTFASPINQRPHGLGVDIVLHSATKYLGGHSDILAGVAVGSEAHVREVLAKAHRTGGSLDARAAALLERSLKTLAVRVERQNENALALARWLDARDEVAQANYPGLERHPAHDLARKQMPGGFGGMLSFELAVGLDAVAFQRSLRLAVSAMSLGGVDTTVCSPHLTSHRRMSRERRAAEGISDRLLRVSCGLEAVADVQADFAQAFATSVVSEAASAAA